VPGSVAWGSELRCVSTPEPRPDAMQSVLPMQVVWFNRGIEGITAILEYMDARRHGDLAPCDGAPAAIDEIPTACRNARHMPTRACGRRTRLISSRRRNHLHSRVCAPHPRQTHAGPWIIRPTHVVARRRLMRVPTNTDEYETAKPCVGRRRRGSARQSASSGDTQHR
jgi:hypothetical protein